MINAEPGWKTVFVPVSWISKELDGKIQAILWMQRQSLFQYWCLLIRKRAKLAKLQNCGRDGCGFHVGNSVMNGGRRRCDAYYDIVSWLVFRGSMAVGVAKMNQSRSRLKRFRYRKCLLVVALLVIVVPYTLQSIQSAREAARRREIRGGRDPAEDFKMLIAMREHYPIVPLGDRLANHSWTDPASDASPSSQMSMDAEKQLIEYEKASHQFVRSYRLRQIHDSYVGRHSRRIAVRQLPLRPPRRSSWRVFVCAASAALTMPYLLKSAERRFACACVAAG
jgi:hypothetical protein